MTSRLVAGRHLFTVRANGEISVDMMGYSLGIETEFVPRAWRQDPCTPMRPGELKQYQQIVGKISWLVTKLRKDSAYDMAVLQREKGRKDGPQIGAIIKANQIAHELKNNPKFAITLKCIGFDNGGLLCVSDRSSAM